VKILIRNVEILADHDLKHHIKNGFIGINGNKIDFIGEDPAEAAKFNPDRVINGTGKIAMPGIVNAHTHAAMTLLRNFANDLSLQDWLFNNVFPVEIKLNDEYVYWGTMLALGELIRSGVTAIADMYLHMDAVANAILESGMRANVCRIAFQFNKLGDEPIDQRDQCRQYFNTWNNAGDGRIKVYVEVHSTYTLEKWQLIKSAELAGELGTGIQIHLHETAREVKESLEAYNATPIEISKETGIFEVPVLAAHCVHVSENDMDILKEYNVNVVYNPTSNMKLGSGVAPVSRMLEKGINVALGTDGAASNNNLNMFEEMHLASLLQKGVLMNPEVMNASTVFKMATQNGAKAIGFENAAGILEKGRLADIILIDKSGLHLTPLNDPLAAVVYSAQGLDVDTVIVDGRILMENKVLRTIDEELVKYKVNKIAGELIPGQAD